MPTWSCAQFSLDRFLYLIWLCRNSILILPASTWLSWHYHSEISVVWIQKCSRLNRVDIIILRCERTACVCVCVCVSERGATMIKCNPSCISTKAGARFLMKQLNVTSDSLYPAQLGPRVWHRFIFLKVNHLPITSNMYNVLHRAIATTHASLFLSCCSLMCTAKLGEGEARLWSPHTCST